MKDSVSSVAESRFYDGCGRMTKGSTFIPRQVITVWLSSKLARKKQPENLKVYTVNECELAIRIAPPPLSRDTVEDETNKLNKTCNSHLFPNSIFGKPEKFTTSVLIRLLSANW